MADPVIAQNVLAAIRRGDEALDRGTRGPGIELALLHEAGLLTAPLDPAAGGRGWGTAPAGALPMLAVLHALGGASLPVARLYEGHVNALKLVLRYGTTAQQAQAAAAATAGWILGVWGADGPTPVAIAAAPADPAPALVGGKAFASGLGDVALAIVTARASDGLQLVLVDARDAARARPADWDVVAMLGSRSGSFDCTALPAGTDQRLGAADALFVEPDFHGGLWRLTACYAGALQRIAQLTAALIRARGTASPLGEARLGQLAMEAEGAMLWATAACQAVEAAAPARDHAVQQALFAREALEQAATRACAIAERIAGTAAHRRASELGRLIRDLRFYLRQADLDGKLGLATSHWLAAQA